jgi:hypothetical protein
MVMSRKMTLELSEELIADLGYVKMYINSLYELKQKYPHSVLGEQQCLYIDNAYSLINKASQGIGAAIKKQEKK